VGQRVPGDEGGEMKKPKYKHITAAHLVPSIKNAAYYNVHDGAREDCKRCKNKKK
jgi:hypothetical protein